MLIDMMDDDCDIEGFPLEIRGEKDNCGNCLLRWTCQSYLDGVGVHWCMFYQSEGGSHGEKRK